MLTVRSISKRYGSVLALDGVSAEFREGEVHAVLGENGAGKSTLMGVLGGFVAPDSGDARLDDRPLPLGDAAKCRRAGIELVHQHFMLVPAFSVEENLQLARLKRTTTSPDLPKRLGWQVSGASITRDLSVGEKQRLEIVKALETDAKVMIFDEPTAVLAREEVEELFGLLRRLRDDGRIVILIAHKLSEVLAIADRVTVLRRGQVVASASRSEVDERTLAEWMVGELPPRKAISSAEPVGEAILTVRDLRVQGDRGELAVRGVDLQVRAGEVVGVGGVDGNGQVELAEAIAGVRPSVSGTMTGPDTVGYIPQDRQMDGLALGLTIYENLLVGGYQRPELISGPFLRPTAIRKWTERLVASFDIRIGKMSDPVGSLSGGNQQKVVVSRTLDRHPKLIVAVNPTRGLDFRSASFVHDQLRLAAVNGAAILLISTDLDELFALSDQAFFLTRGELLTAQDARSVVGG